MSSRSERELPHEDSPYEVIRKLNQRLLEADATIEEYSRAMESLAHEREIALREMQHLQRRVEELKAQVEQERAMRKESLMEFEDLKHRLKLKSLLKAPVRTQFSQQLGSEFRTKLETTKSNLFETKHLPEAMLLKKEESKQEEFIPEPVRLSKSKKAAEEHIGESQFSHEQNYAYAENLIEDFYVIGPQPSEFKRERHGHKNQEVIKVAPAILHSVSKHYKTKKSEFLAEIARRAFPLECEFRKKLVERPEELQDIIEFKPEARLSEDYFVFTLRGDEALLTAKKRAILASSNPNCFLFVVCLKLPEFTYVREERNYQGKESEVWKTEKVYAVATYYPFFPIVANVLCKVQAIVRQNGLQKVSVEGENPLLWGLARNTFDLEKNQEVKELLSYFLSKKPDYNQVCSFSKLYFGSIPEVGHSTDYSIALATCPVFFSNFAYEEFLLLLTAIFCQRTLIFVSESESRATLCALFLVSIISPFKYSEPLLLNCDHDKIKSMIFEFPFAMMCSIKADRTNLDEILYLFSESNVLRSMENDAQHLLINVDTNTILYENAMTNMFESCIVSPSDRLKKAYEAINPCASKSFSLRKNLPKENLGVEKKHLHEVEKREKEKKKNVKEYQERIKNHRTKLPSYRLDDRHRELLQLIVEYIGSFTLEAEVGRELAAEKNKSLRLENVKAYLFHKGKEQNNRLVEYFVQSQMFANYLDSFNEDKFR